MERAELWEKGMNRAEYLAHSLSRLLRAVLGATLGLIVLVQVAAE
jgi:hypothetical protein